MARENHPLPIPVALVRCTDYHSPELPFQMASLLNHIGFQPPRGAKVLVKPNLLAAKPPDFLACTHPQVVRAACEYLLAHDARVTVGDSPTFGTGKKNAREIGLQAALADLPVRVIELNHPQFVRLPLPWGRVAVSREALECDLILNLPKLKVHRMMCLTGAVKNYFGCVTGIFKAFLHLRYGDRKNLFESMLVEVMRLLPPGVTILDAVKVMHITGPVHGSPYRLGLLGASPSAVALDTAVYSLLKLRPGDVPLWRETLARRLPGARWEDLTFPLENLEAFPAQGFQIPEALQSLSFHPLRVAKGLLRNWRTAICEKFSCSREG